MFKSLFDLTKDVVSVVTTPVEMAVDLVSVPVKEAAKVVEELKKDVKSLKD